VAAATVSDVGTDTERARYDACTSFWELVVRAAERRPDDLMAVDEHDRTLTFAEYRDRAERVAAGLYQRGVRAGQTVSWMLPTWLETCLLIAALDRLGVVQNPMLPIYREREVGFITRQARTTTMITPGTWRGYDYAALAKGAVDDVLIVERDRVLPDADPAVLPPFVADPERIAWIFYTSGTTADPKGVKHRHGSVAAATVNMAYRMEIVPSDRAALAFPIAHIGGVNWLMAALICGCADIVIENFADATTMPTLRRHGVTLAGVTTAFHLAYLAAQRANPGERLFPAVRAYPGGAAPKPPQLHYDLVAEVGGVGIVAGFGLTEYPMCGMAAVRDHTDKLAHTEGRPSDGTELIVLDDEGNRVGPNVDGEIRIRGPHLFAGYVDPQLDVEGFDEHGWFKTGDIGHLDEDGYVVITGRLKDVINRKGENISAKEIEDLVYQHPKVVDVAVVGLPDADAGERVCAVVACAPGVEALTFDELRAWLVDQKLITRKLPQQLELVDELPRNAAGKVQKHALRERYGS
jgi:cyclohexanecarboxylate-CoA ligase